MFVLMMTAKTNKYTTDSRSSLSIHISFVSETFCLIVKCKEKAGSDCQHSFPRAFSKVQEAVMLNPC